MSATATRAAILATLQASVPSVVWANGRLDPSMTEHKRTIGGVSTIREEQGPGDLYVTRQLIVQIYGPTVQNQNRTKVVDPATIEDLVDDVMTALEADENGGADYWFIRPLSVNYPSDGMGQQTRAEITFTVWDGTSWG